MHHIYYTSAFILDTHPFGEAGKIITFFTKELGMVRAQAQGVRLLKSKLRYSLDSLSFSDVNLVRGKDMWRLTNAKLLKPLYLDFKHEPKKIEFIARLFSLLRRLLHGEEKNTYLFNVIDNTIAFLYESITPDELRQLEIIALLRVLHSLGYGEKVSGLEHIFEDTGLSKTMLSEVRSHEKKALIAVNSSLRETQL